MKEALEPGLRGERPATNGTSPCAGRCREKMAKSTDAPVCAFPLARGGCTVQPVPASFATVLLVRRRVNDGGSNQNLMLFIRGNAESGASNTWCVQVLRSPKEAFAVAMQSWRERCEKCVCLQGDYVEK